MSIAITHSPPSFNDGRKLHSPFWAALKICIDKCAALIFLILFSPVLLVLALLIKRDGGSIFYGQERVGKDGKNFTCWKLRSMVADADARLQALLDQDFESQAEWAAEQKLKNDPRITKFGQFLRVSSLDEIPQFYNVLCGEMSLVGPRPVTAEEKCHYAESWDDYISVRPGISGLWQVSGRNHISYPKRVRLDRFYVRRWSLWMDIMILLKTPLVVFKRNGAY